MAFRQIVIVEMINIARDFLKAEKQNLQFQCSIMNLADNAIRTKYTKYKSRLDTVPAAFRVEPTTHVIIQMLDGKKVDIVNC